MNTSDYIKQLKDNLSVLPKSKREEIIKEIESYIEESDVDYSILVEKFGTPGELAGNYLEDIPKEEQNKESKISSVRKVIITILTFVIILVAIIAFVIYNIMKDPFDYSKYNATTIEEKIKTPWVVQEDINTFDIEQSKVVIYWHNKNNVQISCQGNTQEKTNNTFIIKQSECILKLPKQHFNIKSYQSNLVLIEPSEALEFDSKQSKISIAKNSSEYNFQLNGSQSDIKNLGSKEDGISIKGQFYQSKISNYSY